MMRSFEKPQGWIPERREPPAPHHESSLAWLNKRSPKTKFVVAALVLFLGYGLVLSFVQQSGIRPPHVKPVAVSDADRDCTVDGMALEERAKCIIARDDARDRQYKERRAKEIAERKIRDAEEKALKDEVALQRRAKLKATGGL